MSFGAEMKDFIAAFQVGTQIKDRRRAMALDVQQEENRSKEASNQAAAVEARYQRTQAYNQEGRDYTRKKDETAAATAATEIDYQHSRDATSDTRQANTAADAAWYKQVEADPQMGYEPDGVTPIPPPSQRGQPKEGIPTESTPAGPGRPGPVSSSGMSDLVINHETVANALNGGLKELSNESNKSGIQSVMEGAGAPDSKTVAAIDNIIDPNNTMSEAEISLARIEGTYEFYVKRGDIEKADKAAAAWLQHARGMAAIKATEMQVKLDQGDVAGAAQTAADMHDSIPDGHSTTFDKASNTLVTTDDQTGEVVMTTEATMEKLDQIAAAFTKGPEFFNLMKSAAMRSTNFNKGAEEAKANKPVTSKPFSEKEDPLAADVPRGTREEVDTAIFDIASKELVDVDGKPVFKDNEEFLKMVGEDSVGALSDISMMIIAHNPDVTPKEATKLSMIITDPDQNVGSPGDQHFDGFEVLPISVDNRKAGIDIMVIRTPDGRELELPGNAFSTAFKTANHGLFIAAKETTQKNVDETNSRVTNDNNQYNLQRAEDLRLQEERRTGKRTGRGNVYVPQALPGVPPKRTGRGGF